MAKMLVVKLTAAGSDKPLFERDIFLDEELTLANVPYSSIIDSLDVMYRKIPHDVEFIISEI